LGIDYAISSADVNRAFSLIIAVILLAPPASAKPQPRFARALLTYYWNVDENAAQYRRGSSIALRDVRGNVIAHTTSSFRHALVREGAGTLRDGRMVMYEMRRHGAHRFRVVTHPLTVSGCGMIPYRTAAVDPRLIKLGSKIYVPQLKGTPLPDGTIHDGIFVATDCGRFRGKHIDIFVGDSVRYARPFVRRGYPSRSRVSVYLVQ